MPSAYFINQFANTPDMAGHTRQYEIAKELKNRGWEVEIFASDFNLSERIYKKLPSTRISLVEHYDGIKWNWLRVLSYKRNNWRRYINLSSFCIHIFLKLTLSNLIKGNKYNPDIIVASSPQLPAAFISLYIAKILRRPFVLEVRDLWPQVLIDKPNSDPNSILIKLLKYMEKKLYRDASKVIVLAKGSVSYVKERGASNISWLPNGPDLNLFKYYPLPIESEIFNLDRPFMILYAGAHGEMNAIDNVIKAASLLRNYPISFTFIGDGPEKISLIKNSISLKNIIFKDPIPKALMPDLISKYDAFLLSLRDIPLFRYGVSPNKLYDAYALARPMIATVPGDINKEIEDNKLGVTAPAENPEALANSIKELFITPRAERQLMGNRARKLAEDVYSRQKINESYHMILSKLINK